MQHESKQWSKTVLGFTALLSVSVGVAVGLIASNSAASTVLYAPATVQPSVASVAAIRAARPVTQVQAELTTAEPAQEVEIAEQAVYSEAPQAFNWAPVAALIALPTAIAAFLLRKTEEPRDVEAPLMNAKLATAGVAASILMASSTMAPMPAKATESIFRLTPCAETTAFQKREKKEIKGIEKRQKNFEEGSQSYLELESIKTQTHNRFAKYGQQFLCGEDGLPHLIAEPGLAIKYGRAGEILIPSIGFLYIAGYIGTAGRTYLREISSREKPQMSEIIIDVPLALNIAFRSWNWPGQVLEEHWRGEFVEKDENIPVSPR